MCRARRLVAPTEREDALLDTAQLLVNVAVKGHILIHETDRETALYWIRKALPLGASNSDFASHFKGS
jgi:hypothetical protein